MSTILIDGDNLAKKFPLLTYFYANSSNNYVFDIISKKLFDKDRQEANTVFYH